MTITVAELVQDLLAVDQTAIVVLSEDAEGNGYSPLSAISLGKYSADTTWSGEFTDDPEADYDDMRDAVCLWPIN